MKIRIIAEYLDDISNPSTYNSRFLTIAEELVLRGHEVQIVTTDFVHSLKKHIKGVNRYKDCEVIALHEPGYRKNVSLRRFYSHYVLSKELRKWLQTADKTDVIYCAVPSLDFAYEAAKYAKKNNIKFVVDIQDLWPEAFELVLHVPIASYLIFTPFRIRANYIYRAADGIVAVSQTYLDRAKRVNSSKCPQKVVFLGTNLSRFDSFEKEAFPIEKGDRDLWLGYVGTLGHSYDLRTVMDAMKQTKLCGDGKYVKLIVMGDGPLREEFEAYAQNNGLPVSFTGKLPYPSMVAGLKKCDIAINPIKKGAAQSIINKHADYAAAGIALLNTQESVEYRTLIDRYQMGINCKCEDASDLADAMKRLLDSPETREAMGVGARRCARECFDRQYTYGRIVEIIEN